MEYIRRQDIVGRRDATGREVWIVLNTGSSFPAAVG